MSLLLMLSEGELAGIPPPVVPVVVSYSGDVDSALIGKLLADTGAGGVMTYMTDGVWYDIAAAGKTKFVIVKLMSHTVQQEFGSKAYEAPVYLVKAVEFGTGTVNTKAAAARIDALLDGGTLTVTGYGLMKMQLEEYVRYTEADPVNADARWQHRGGMYSVWVAPS